MLFLRRRFFGVARVGALPHENAPCPSNFITSTKRVSPKARPLRRKSKNWRKPQNKADALCSSQSPAIITGSRSRARRCRTRCRRLHQCAARTPPPTRRARNNNRSRSQCNSRSPCNNRSSQHRNSSQHLCNNSSSRSSCNNRSPSRKPPGLSRRRCNNSRSPRRRVRSLRRWRITRRCLRRVLLTRPCRATRLCRQ